MSKAIVVPLDGGSLAEQVLPYAALGAANYQEDLVMVQAVSDPKNLDAARQYLDGLRETMQRSWKRRVENIPAIRSQVEVGPAAEVILETSTRQQASRILMSSRGRNSLTRWISGSVTASVLRGATVPVILLHPACPKEAGLNYAFGSSHAGLWNKTILVPLDGTPRAEAALSYAADLARISQRPLVLLEALPSQEDLLKQMGAVWGYYGYSEVYDLEKAEQKVRLYLSKVERERQLPSNTTILKVQYGQPAQAIIECARECRAGLIVMSAEARSRVGRALPGSVSDQVVRDSGLPVMLINPRRQVVVAAPTLQSVQAN